MKLRTLLLPAGALTGAALLLAPREATGFSLGGGSLSLSQRDFRTFDNFTDASANNNVTPDAQFPGYTGAEMAIWKGSVEWGSGLHGTGGGDPHQPAGVGSGGANFDASFQGNATGVGTTNENIHSELGSSCGGGTLAFTELPISDGWRIRYCPEWSWADGPGSSVSGVDLQGVACHEYGHALGLGHSGFSGATMFPSISGTGVAQRSLHSDDIAGVKAIYGVKSASKPNITGVSVAGAQVTISGTNFSATNNEVWFTQKGVGGTGSPVKLTGVTSSGGTSIVVTAPANAGKGDVLVRNNGTGHANLSNAWPTDVTGTGGGGTIPTITSITPSSIDAVTPDTESIQVTGTNFTGITSITLDGVSLAGSFAVADSTTINITLPLWTTLGDLNLVVTNASGSDSALLGITACQPPVVDLINSDPFFLLNLTGITVTTGSEPGDVVFVQVSPDNLPSVIPGMVNLGIGNGFTTLVQLQSAVVPAKGWVQIATGPTAIPAGTHVYVQAASFPNDSGGVDLVEVSNIQHGLLVF